MIIELQRRIAEVGRIRIGQQVESKNGKRPTKLSTFRLTSPDKTRILNAAKLFGGTPTQWDAPAGPQWECITETDTLNVIVPPSDMSFSQFYELWSAGGCQRRCDGQTASFNDNGAMQEGECLCDPDKRECQLHTRLSVMIRDLPGLGVWRIDTQGYYAAVELQGAVDIINIAAGRGQMLPARLRLEQRMIKRPGTGTRRFAVPVLDIEVTPGQLLGGAPVGIDATAGTLAIEAPPAEPAKPLCACENSNWQTDIMEQCSIHAPKPDKRTAPLTPVPKTVPERPTPSVAEQAAAPVKTRRRSTTPRVPATGLKPRTAQQIKTPAEMANERDQKGADWTSAEESAVAEQIPLPDEPLEEPEPPPTAAMNRKMHACFRDLNITDRDDRLALTSFILDRPITTSDQMTISDASKTIDTLENWLDGKYPKELDVTTPEELVNEVLNLAALKQAEQG